jgi:hypothetical protein
MDKKNLVHQQGNLLIIGIFLVNNLSLLKTALVNRRRNILNLSIEKIPDSRKVPVQLK